jgi:hypothetical protein
MKIRIETTLYAQTLLNFSFNKFSEDFVFYILFWHCICKTHIIHFLTKPKTKLMKKSMLGLSALVVAIAMFASMSASAGEHPAYLRALSDLRAARWNLEHRPGNWKQTEDEMVAVKEIDAAIREITKAGIDDHKDLNDHPKDDINENAGRFRKALEYLHKADADVDEHESNEAARGLKEAAHLHIREAIHRVDNAVQHIR